MKKTIALILAAASLAVADEPKLTVDNKDGSAKSSYAFNSTDINATVVVNLNMQNLRSIKDVALIFTLDGSSSGGAGKVSVGLGMDYVPYGFDGDFYMDAWVGSHPEFSYLDLDLTGTAFFTAEHGIVVYTLAQDEGGKITMQEYLYLYDSEGTMLTSAPLSGMIRERYAANYENLTSFTLNPDLMYEADVYNSVLEGDALAAEMIESYLGKDNTESDTNTDADTTVPEPATATLSLLALASLAARRRRK